MIAALFVSEEGPYAADPRFDAWGVGRDARTWPGGSPVIAHPPCERWGRMAKGSPRAQLYEVGDDGGCFQAALDAVRTFGGVIEHPQGSHAFGWHGLPIPSGRGWTPADPWGGRSTYIDQGAYGHPAKKPTWLYAILPTFPRLNWTRVWGRPYIGGDGYHGKAERDRAKASSKGVQKMPQIPKDWNWRTPDALKDELHAMAASCIGWTPRRIHTCPPLGILEANHGR